MRYRRVALVGLLIIFIGIALLVWGLVGLTYAYAGKMPFGVTIQGQQLAGLSASDAVARLAPLQNQTAGRTVALSVGTKSFQPSLADVGLELDTTQMINEAIALGTARKWYATLSVFMTQGPMTEVPLRYKINQDTFNEYYATVRNSLPNEPKDITLDYQNGAIVTLPAEEGVLLDANTFQQSLERELPEVASGQKNQIIVPVIVQRPTLANESQVADAKQTLQKLLAKPLEIQVEDTKLKVTPEEIYSYVSLAQQDNQLVVTFDEPKVKAKAVDIGQKVTIKAVAKKVNSTDNSTIAEGRDGRKINTSDATKQILDRLRTANFDTPITLTAEKIDRPVLTQGPEYTLGRTDGKYIDINLTQQRLNIIEGTNHIQGFTVSTGKWSTPTPIGEFAVHNHIPTAWSARYKLYMDNWMAIVPDGLYGIHQLPRWPNGYVEGSNHIGTPVSHGCIRLSPQDAPTVYNWAVNGTKVYIHE